MSRPGTSEQTSPESGPRAASAGDRPPLEWRSLFSELLGTFFLVLVAAGAPMVDHAYAGAVGRAAAVSAPGMMVMAIILFMGHVSGAHLNPAVTLAFTLRRDFPWLRVPGYLLAQGTGAVLASLLLASMLGVSARHGGTFPGAAASSTQAMGMEVVLTFGLVSVILGTASGAQNVGMLGALGVGGYIALAGLWASPVSGASMNPARSLGPDLVAGTWDAWWAYLVGPLLGAVLAVGAGWLLRGRGGGPVSSVAAQGIRD